MTRLLEHAIAAANNLPTCAQDDIARVILRLTGTIRRMTVLPYRHLTFYEATEDEIIIHAVRYAARNPSDMLGAGT